MGRQCWRADRGGVGSVILTCISRLGINGALKSSENLHLYLLPIRRLFNHGNTPSFKEGVASLKTRVVLPRYCGIKKPCLKIELPTACCNNIDPASLFLAKEHKQEAIVVHEGALVA